MREEMRNEVVELTVSACEKFASNYEVFPEREFLRAHNIMIFLLSLQTAARVIKDNMDKKFGIYWHVVVGEGFGFEVSYETENILYLFFGGNMAIVLWKCS